MSVDRIKRLRALMQEAGYDSLLVSPGPNLRYLSGVRYTYPGDPWDMEIVWEMYTAAIIPLDGNPILVGPRHNESWIRSVSTIKDIRWYSGAENRAELFKELLKGVKGTLGVERQLPFKIYRPLVDGLPRLKVRDASDVLSESRLIKSDEEIECMRRAARIVEQGVKAGREAISESVTEREVSLVVEQAMREKGAESISYCVVQTGAKTATWDPPTGSRVKKGDIFIMDLSATYEGYHADITRVTVVGEPSSKQKKVFDVVLNAQARAIDSVRPGVKAGSVNEAAKQVIDNGGYGEFLPFGIGHGLGLEPHEAPHLTEYKDMEMVLHPGIVMTIEPTLNLPGEFGVRVEDDILVTKKGRESLTTMRKELVVI